jgi:serine-type D-Ala-D-Ala carboxypeptidase/endopeptidase (penicillin-binding protein 4)
MTSSLRSVRLLLVLLLSLFVAMPAETVAQQKKSTKKSSSPRKKITNKSVSKSAAAQKKSSPKAAPRRAPAPAAPAAFGATFEQRLASLMNSSVAASSNSSLLVVDVETGRVVGQRNPNMPVAPASNMKLFTTAAGHELLKDPFLFRTSVYMRGRPDQTGTLQGDVKIVGRGDPTIGGRFHDGNATAVIERFAREIKQAGVKTIGGNLIFEYGYMDQQYVHPTWPVDQLVNWYEAPVSAFSMQEGCVMVRILPSKPGQRAIVEMEPKNNYLSVQNTCVTGGGRGIFVTRQQNSNNLIVRGNVPARAGASDIYVTVVNPIHYFASVTRTTFEREGIRILGSVGLVKSDPRPDWKLVTEHKTPLQIVNYVINKKSQNHYAEQLLKTIGAEMRNDGSWAGGSQAVTEWLVGKVGVPPGEYKMIDGSGMSRFNRASANAFVLMLRHMWKSPHRAEFVASMPYTGEQDSRLRRRLNQQPYARSVYAKTGYIVGVIGLSGYVHAESGKVYAFSFLFNKYPTGVWGVYRLQDEMLKEIVKGG